MSEKEQRQQLLLEQFQCLESRMKVLKGIVQNPGMQVSDESLKDWMIGIDNLSKSLHIAKAEVVDFYKGAGR